MHLRDIAAFVLQHTTLPHPILSLPRISSCSLRVGGLPLGYEPTKSKGVGQLSMLFVLKISDLCDHNPPTLQTDDMRSQYCALHYSASHDKNDDENNKFVTFKFMFCESCQCCWYFLCALYLAYQDSVISYGTSSATVLQFTQLFIYWNVFLQLQQHCHWRSYSLLAKDIELINSIAYEHFYLSYSFWTLFQIGYFLFELYNKTKSFFSVLISVCLHYRLHILCVYIELYLSECAFVTLL